MAPKTPKKVDETVEKEEVPITEENIILRNIKIVFEKVENVDPIFTAADIYIEVKHSENIIGQSDKIPVFEKSIVLIDYETEFSCNVACDKTLDELLSCPLYFTVWQVPGEVDINLYPSRSETSEDTATPAITKESISSLYEAILGVKWDEEPEEGEEQPEHKKVSIKVDKEKEKEQEKGTQDKGSDISSKSSKEKKSEESINPLAGGAVCVGCCNLDLLPFFLGKKHIHETIPLQQEIIHLDDQIVTHPNLPMLSVIITIDKHIFEDTDKEEDTKLTNILNVTVESIYNIPECFCESTEYKIATLLPTEKLTLKPVCLEGVYKESVGVLPQYKIWPNLTKIENFCSNTNEIIDDDVTKIKNKTGINLNKLKLKSGPRITWNILKKCWLTKNATDFFQKTIIRYRQWPIEIFLTPTDNSVNPEEEKGIKVVSNQSRGDSKGSEGSNETGESDKKKCVLNPEIEHLMGFVDITSLLYPGVKTTRVACELRTFQQKEFTNATGFNDSYFRPKPPPVPETAKKEPAAKKDSKKDKKGGKDKDSKKEISKNQEKSAEKENAPEPEPSQPVLNEKGEPTFIILEFELMLPFQQRRVLPDLIHTLLLDIPRKELANPSVLNVRFAAKFYHETIIKLGCEIIEQRQAYKRQHKDATTLEFIKFLQHTGKYQQYYTTLSKAVIYNVKEKFNYTSGFENPYPFHNFTANVYTYMQNILNTQIHELMSCNMVKCVRKNNQIMSFAYFTIEALENKMVGLAERYSLEAVTKNSHDPNNWLNLAVFYLLTRCPDRAFECLKEALALKVDHKYVLLLFGILLYEKGECYLSETTFLTLISYHPKFMAGWVCLYIFYQQKQQYEGCDYCLEMIMGNNENIVNDEDDYILNTDGLSWTTALCNSDNVFYRTALLLIKLGALKFADIALSINNFNQDGIYRYYQAVILYFSIDYEHALMHLADAKKLHGPDYAVNSLIGHCHYHSGNYKEAKEAYEFIVEAFNRPEDMHVVYMNLSFIYESEKNYEVARKYMRYVCKSSPTAYSWLILGILFYRDNDYVNAKAYIDEANMSDIRLPEPWAYLVLINLKFGNEWIAQQCHSQMLRFKLKNEVLLAEVESEMKKCSYINK